jgi:class 3 adenylate cyclase/tetratricopeptide (TPR) repeat protein
VICTNCGTENRVGAKFCTECATPLAQACPNCGTANAPTAKFCSECATALAGAPARPAGVPTAGPLPVTSGPAGAIGASLATTATGTDLSRDGHVAERRMVTVMFTDLVGFTPFAEERDAEEVRETLSRYFELASELIGRYGGTVEKFIGDAVMAVWGAPVAREDDAERAVRAALELVAAVRTLGPGIQARCGVLTGEAAVTIGATNQGMVAGDIVNTAARLQSVAQPGTVLVSESTQRSAAGSVIFEEAGDQVLKGKASPVPAWRALRVVAERGGRNRSDTLEAPFVGRDEELRQLKDLFHAAARERKPRLVSAIGPAGIGKTRLAWEFLKYVDGLVDLAWWHAGRSPAYGDGISFWALGEMVRARAGLLESDDEATSRSKVTATVQQHVPDPEERAWIESALLALLGFGGSTGSPELFAAWRTFFERLATSAPVIMVFEDLHHADSGLLDFIDHLMEWSRGVPITVITLARPELLERRSDWGAGKRTFASIHLEPLSRDAMRELLAGLVPGLPEAAVEAIVGRADGIPLYAVETVRMLLAQGRLVADGGAYQPTGDLGDVAVPESLTALIAARLDGLDPTDRGLIEDAAVLGQSFTLAGLASVSGMDRDELERRLLSFVRRELLVLDLDPRSPERGQYRFVQALIREVAYNTLARKDRKVRHLAAARFFESLGSDELAGGLAGHYLAAQRLAADDAEAAALAAQARIALRGAAERAAALGSHEQAVVFLEQAIGITADPSERADLHARALASATTRFDLDVILRHADAAVAARRETGDREAIATAVAAQGGAVSKWAIDPERALTILEPAWEEFADLEQTSAGVDLMSALARSNSTLNRTENQMAWAERLLPIAERLNRLDVIVFALMGRGAALMKMDRMHEGTLLTRGAHELALAHDFREIEWNGRVLLTFYDQWDDPARAVAMAKEGLEIAKRLGSRLYAIGMYGNAVVSALRTGEWAVARSMMDEALALDTTSGVTAEYYCDRAVLEAVTGGDPAPWLENARRSRADITDPQYESYGYWAEAWGHLAAGRYGEARSAAEHAVRVTGIFRPLAWPIAAHATIWGGDHPGARAILEAFDGAALRGAAVELDHATLRAAVAGLEGRGSEALAGLRDSIKGFRSLGLAFDAALATIDLVSAIPGAVRSTPEIADWVDEARATLGTIGGTPFLSHLDAGLARAAEADVPRRPASSLAPSVPPRG